MAARPILVLDAGTTSTRAMLFDADGAVLGQVAHPLTQHYPRPGWVEHDAAEIRDRTLDAARAMVGRAGGAERIAGIGITNQRETAVFWDRRTGEPLARALVWQDRRTAGACRAMAERGEGDWVRARTGLPLDPYFTGSKIAWALEHCPAVAEAGDDLAVGTVDSWLLWHLTGGRHATDATNASRTQLIALDGGWDDALCALWTVPRAALPEITDSAGALGTTPAGLFGAPVPITGIAGDQQAATVGQGCLVPGQVKATFGTGAFVLASTGATPRPSDNGLLTTVAAQVAGRRSFALEGSIFVAGSLIQWLRDEWGLVDDAADTEALARSVPDNAGVTIVPALSGLGAPWWRPDARGAVTGLSFAAGRAHLARAALEAITLQTADLQRAFAADGISWATLKIDGGMSANGWLAQDLADQLDCSVDRPAGTERTALGAAVLAAVGLGRFADLGAAAIAMGGSFSTFQPAQSDDLRQARAATWRAAVERVVRAGEE